MRFKITFLFLSILFMNCSDDCMDIAAVTNAPILKSSKTLGGSKNEIAKAIVKTSDGGYAILGYTQSTNGDITSKTEDSFDYWLLKYNNEDTLLWKKTYGGTKDDKGQDLVTTPDGGFLISGYVTSNDGDVSANAGSQDFWAAKIDSNGSLIWEKTYGFSGSDRVYDIINTSDGGFLMSGVLDVTASGGAGNTNSLHAGGDYWAVKINATGNLQWSKYFGGNFSDDPYGVTEDNNGDFVLVGASDSIDNDISNNKGSYDVWAVKISSSGTLIWEKSFGGTQIDEAKDILTTTEGDYLIVGNTRSFDKDITNNKGGADVWLLKVDTNGKLIWNKTIGGSSFDIGESITKSKNGYLIAGSSRSFDIDISKNQGQNDALILEVDNNGNLIWEKTIGGSEFDTCYDIIQEDNGKIIAVGETNSSDGNINTNKGFTDLLIITLQ